MCVSVWNSPLHTCDKHFIYNIFIEINVTFEWLVERE